MKSLLFYLIIACITSLGFSCSQEDSASSRYKKQLESQRSAATADSSQQNNDRTTGDGSNGNGNGNDSDETGSGDDEETGDGVTPPNQQDQAAAQLKAQGMQIYDTSCQGCHMPVAQTTIIARAAANIAGAAQSPTHVMAGINNNFPNQQQAEAVLAYILDPN